MSIEPPEPTDEDYCHMAGHPISHMDENTGWDTCYCGYVIAPSDGEPHDEYSAAVADLVDEYIWMVHVGQKKDRFKEDVHAAHHHAYTVLMRMDIPFLQQLIESARASSPEHLGHTESMSYETAVLLGVHLDYNGVNAVRAACNRGNGVNPPVSYYRDSFHNSIKTSELLPIARTAAKLYSLLSKKTTSRPVTMNWGREASDFVAETALLLVDHPERITEAASIFNSNESYETAIHLTKAIVKGELETPPSPLLNGLL